MRQARQQQQSSHTFMLVASSHSLLLIAREHSCPSARVEDREWRKGPLARRPDIDSIDPPFPKLWRLAVKIGCIC